MVYVLDKSYTFPILVKDTDKYYVAFNNEFLYVKNEDVKEVVASENSDLNTLKDIAVLTYHFFYDKALGETCNQVICMEISEFEKQLSYLKENNFFTATMEEMEWFLDSKIRLPEKSVLITIDDGFLLEHGIKMLEKYNMQATLFLITAWTQPEDYISPSIELHSHGHDLHNQYVCPGGQGGGIKCLPHDHLVEDLTTSRNELNQTTAFCYPFYEFNDYAISILKETGFTMAFKGGWYKAYPGVDKFQIPRYTILNDTSFNEFVDIVN
jgi:peptidoglycan/xylan/chitin deacetylase (PgdA/CDA1 family)